LLRMITDITLVKSIDYVTGYNTRYRLIREIIIYSKYNASWTYVSKYFR